MILAESLSKAARGTPSVMHLSKFNCVLASAIALLLAGLQPVSAAVIVFTNPALFDAAVTGETTHDFAGIAPPGGLVVVSPTVDGVNFSSNNTPFVIDNGLNPNYGVPFFSGQGNTQNVPANEVVVSLGGFNAIGFFYGSYASQNEPYSATLNTGDVFPLLTPPVAADVNFIGFVSDAGPITSINFTSLAGPNTLDTNGNPLTPFGFAFDITQFDLANPNQVPEPLTISLFGTGVAGALALRRRKRKSAKS
jgi:hypothetical protein